MILFLMCLKIFFVRILDVSLGTVRTIITVKGKILLASTVGFIEVLIWFLVAREALNTDNTSIFIAISYSLGFASGTYIGGKISEKFIKGTFSVQIITGVNGNEIAEVLRKEGYGASVINVNSSNEKSKYMILVEIDRSRLDILKNIIRKLDSKAFVVVNETKYVQNGYFGK